MSPFRTTYRYGSVKELLNPLQQSTLSAQVSATSSQNSSIFHKTVLLGWWKESASSASPTWGHEKGVEQWQPGKLGKESQAEEAIPANYCKKHWFIKEISTKHTYWAGHCAEYQIIAVNWFILKTTLQNQSFSSERSGCNYPVLSKTLMC